MKKISPGFTLLELLLSIAIFAIVLGFTAPLLYSFQAKNELDLTVNKTAQYLRRAQLFSQAGREDDSWGFMATEEKIILFKGESYAERDSDFDEIFLLPREVTLSGLSEVVFEKLTGIPQDHGEIVLSLRGRQSKGIKINQWGIIDYEDVFVALPQKNPLGYWPLDENEGCIAFDLYGDNDGVLDPDCPQNSPEWIEGKINSALYFDGTNRRVSVADSPELNPVDALTLTAWVKWDIEPNEGNDWATIINKNVDSQYRLQHDRTNDFFEFAIRTSSGGRWIWSTTSPQEGDWHHVAGTYDGEEMRIYIDGTLENAQSWSGEINASTNPLIFGNRAVGDRGFHGIIDEIGIWERALSEEEINDLYLAGLEEDTYTLSLESNPLQGGTTIDETGALDYEPGDIVNIKAEANPGYIFVSWTTEDGGTISNPSSSETTYVMPSNNVTIVANFEEDGDFCGGSGSVEDPYLICTANNLDKVREGLSLHYRLENDIDLNIAPYNTGEGWLPIGSSENSFTGVFDGGGNIISNLYINRTEEDYIGLFGHINATPGEEAKVYDLGLVNVNITGRSYTGGVTGYIGGVWNADGKITRSYVEGSIQGEGNTGGVAGYTGYKSYLENVYSMCSIEGGWGTGGISGSHWGTNNFIVNSYSISELSPGGGVGGIIGQGISGNVINSYWNTDIYPSSPAGTGKTTEEMKDINTFSGWDISTSSIDLNEGYPYFGWQEDRDDFAWLISGESDPEPLINKATDKNKFTTNYVDFGSAGNLAESEPLSALWQVNQGGENLDIWVNYDMGEKKEINTYELTPTTIDPSRSPKSWIFQGADTIEGPYETIDTRENITGWVGEVPVTFSLSETANNRYYRLLISESNHDLRLALSRLRILF